MAGVAGLRLKANMKAKLKAKGEQLAELEISTLSKQMEEFKTKLQKFALKHGKVVSKDPEFRRDFQRMCDVSGVDALASKKGFWAEVFGMGDFYYKLGVQIVDICLATRSRNGGLIPMSELIKRLDERRPAKLGRLSVDDVERAIAKLKVLGDGFQVHNIGSAKMVQSIPQELNADHTRVCNRIRLFEIVADSGFISVSNLMAQSSWSIERTQQILNEMVKGGMAWVDMKTPNGEAEYVAAEL